ncbi:hypothetical protein RM51_11975 [Chryseobacterium taiwanense]|uniref:Uncharacterized protein n=2 Tax=Chryseobacterium taiwanense TaxID=363331 RepID=A0A0B4CMR0_9FLAO|nr:hypothetical protein RM51_11975 [Chryseobacterium taiwanense]
MELIDQHKQTMKNKFLNFILKYKYYLIFIIFFAFISFIFNPKQKEHYLAKDIQTFKEGDYLTIAIIGSGILMCLMLTIAFLKKFKINQILNSIVFISFICFSIFFLMENTAVSFCLFINRLSTKKEIFETYETFQITDKKYFTAGNIRRPNNFINEVDYYKYFGVKDASKLKPGDTITLHFKQGLLNINYFNLK